MCSPTALAVTSLATTVIGTGVRMYGQLQSADAASGMAQYQAAVARNNQIIADQAAEDAKRRGTEEVARNQLRARQIIGRQRAGLAAQGVMVDTGSAAEITADTAMLAELESLDIRNNAEREAIGFRNRAAGFGAQSDLYNFRSQNYQSAGRAGAFASFVTGSTSVASKWYKFKNEGVL